MRKRGFTLVELLAVIVILAIILAIAVPSISNMIKSSTKSAFGIDAKMVLKAIDYKKLADESFDSTSVNETNINTLLGLSNANYQSLSITTIGGNPYVLIVGKNKWAGLIAYGISSDIVVSDNGNYDTIAKQVGYNSDKTVNEPKLATGMVPIKWDGSTWVDTTSSDTSWYSYDTANKKWANARTADGSMWVWIPRYIYKISSGWHSNTTGSIDIQFSKGIDDNWNSSVIGNISTDTTSNSSNNTWTNHPAFTFGDTELTGIWVAKFEATASEGVLNGYYSDWSCPISGDDVSTKTVKIMANVQSWRCMSIGNAFTASRNMETNSVYGWGTSGDGIDTHLMKNSEWGVITYLSKSNYGKTDQVWVNNSQTYTTGCAGNSVTEGAYNGCENTYNTTNGVKASTTGTVYGIYDMAGGSWERVSAYVNNGNSNLNTYGSSIISADTKYKDIYTKGATDDQASNYALAINHKGDAIYEISSNTNGTYSWYSEYSFTPNTVYPWVARSGIFSDTTLAGLYYYSGTYGSSYSFGGFRPVLAVNTGL